MFTIQPTSDKHRPNSRFNASRRHVRFVFGTSIVIAATALIGCGQKGDLYLVNANNQAAQESTAILNSGSNTQATAVAKSDSNPQSTDDFQLPEPSSDPNDY